MLIMVIGGAASGKSDFAENLCMKLSSKPKCYAATMQFNSHDSEAVARIERHRNARAEHGFDTKEVPTELFKADFSGYDTVLLECLGNLLANEMFSVRQSAKDAETAVKNGIAKLAGAVANVIIVTNNIFSDGEDYSPETMQYIEALGRISVWLAGIADEAYEVVCGIPLKLGNKQMQPVVR